MKITSKQNEYVKYLKKLQQRKYREQEGKFLLEGWKDLSTALEENAKIVGIIYADEKVDENHQLLQEAIKREIPLQKVSLPVLKNLSQTVTPQGVLALVKMRNVELSQIEPKDSLLVLDRIQDPGNLGTILRSALAFGYENIVLLEGSVDPYNDKVLRAAAGSIFQLNLFTNLKKQQLFALVEQLDLPLVISVVEKGQEGTDQSWLKEPMALVIGNEGQGVDPEIQAQGQRFLSIRMKKGIESLNAGVAASILMYLTSK
ncbi:MAG: RNA methyltransferase [Firmicutes bacterium]|jgi:TrmH family RNA methyltransferase|nr:RNA methyltransferase [Bacillota bacterium]